jgi:hypothetical protein
MAISTHEQRAERSDREEVEKRHVRRALVPDPKTCSISVLARTALEANVRQISASLEIKPRIASKDAK